MPEIAVILGGHEHTPFAGRMGHGANAAAVPMDVRASREGGDTECVNDLAGTLCVKAGMDAENVVVVVVEAAVMRRELVEKRGGHCTRWARKRDSGHLMRGSTIVCDAHLRRGCSRGCTLRIVRRSLESGSS